MGVIMKKYFILLLIFVILALLGLQQSCIQIAPPKLGQTNNSSITERNGKLYFCERYYSKIIRYIQGMFE